MTVQAYYALLKMPMTYAMDRDELTAHYHEAMAQVHPDKFANLDAASRRVAQQWAMRIQEAYQTLANPVDRGRLWCDALKCPVQAETNTAMPASFLMRQMALHEALESADETAKNELIAQEKAHQAELEKAITQAIDEDHDGQKAREYVRELMFVVKWLTQAQA